MKIIVIIFTLILIKMLFLSITILSVFAFFLAKRRIIFLVSRYQGKSRSLPTYYGMTVALWNFIISFIGISLIYLLKIIGYEINVTYGYLIIFGVFIIILVYIFAALKAKFRAQSHFEVILTYLLAAAVFISFSVSLTVIATILIESIKFFSVIPVDKFLFGTSWSPQAFGLEDENIFGMIPVLTGTLLITLLAISIALPFGLFSAIYLSEYSSKKFRNIIKPIIEILAGIPTIVYGYFALLVMGPVIRAFGDYCGLDISTESALAAGIVMGIMLVPFILSLSDDAINAVPQNLRDAALALGSTKAEMLLKIVLPAAMPGISSAVLLAISRAIGETMIVTMAAGVAANLSFNPLNSVTTFTAQIVSLLVGDHEFDSPKTLAAFALALTLFIITLLLNLAAAVAGKKMSKKYE